MGALAWDVLKQLKSPRILVLGDLILDRYVFGSVQKVSLEAPVQILNVEREEARPGGAANLAMNLASLGASVVCAGSVGRDPHGEQLIELLSAGGCDVSSVLWDDQKPTPVKSRMIALGQHVLRMDRESVEDISKKTSGRLLSALRRVAKKCDLVMVSDYKKGTMTKEICRALIGVAQCPVLVGLKGRDHRKYRGAAGASLNRSELAHLSGHEDLDRGARQILKELNLKFLVVTMGKDGLRLYRRSGPPAYFPAIVREVRDITGAGDTALAAFGIGHASGLPLEDCAKLSIAAAGVVVGKLGTATVVRDELGGSQKIRGLETLLPILGRARTEKNKIVFTNGCFDLLHVGHISTLEFSKRKGDLLIVGLNSDTSVRTLKGLERPIVPQEDRARMLAALQAVDYVVIFDEPDPSSILEKIRPDVIVKGGDYEGLEVAGSKSAGSVEFSPFVDGLSTSKMIERLRK